MTYRGKSLPEVQAEGEIRQREKTRREEKYRRAYRRMLMDCTVTSAVVFFSIEAACAVAFATWWPPLIGLAVGTIAGFAVAWLNFCILRSMIVFGMLAVLPALSCFMKGKGVASTWSGLGQLVILFCVGLLAPIIYGAIVGWWRQTWDRDHLLI